MKTPPKTPNTPKTPKAPFTGAGYAFHNTNNEGKHRTSLNAYKHGLTGQIHIFSAEEEKAFETHCAAIVEALAPVGPVETDLAHVIAQNRWRLKRVCVIESGIFAAAHDGRFDAAEVTPYRTDPAEVPKDDALSQARTWLANSDKLQLLALYEQRINRTVERNMAELRTLQAAREAARDRAVQEAVLLSQLAKTKGEAYDAAADYPPHESVISVAEFKQLVARQERLDEARALPKNRISPNPGRKMPAAA